MRDLDSAEAQRHPGSETEPLPPSKEDQMHIMRQIVIMSVIGLTIPLASGADGEHPGSARKVVLVELFTSQGCDMCPSAERLIGDLGSLGYGPDRVVPITFHVDYFNKPWTDTLSQNLFSRREYQYSTLFNEAQGLKNPDYLYLTPLIMIDGRAPMLGTDDNARNHKARPKAKELLDAALREPPSATISLSLSGKPGDLRRTLSASVSSLDSDLAGRNLLLGVATIEDGVVTKVGSGENAGKTYVSRFAARKLDVQPLRLSRGRPSTLSVPVTLDTAWDASKCGLAAFVQDPKTGRIHQAATIPWVEPSAAPFEAAKSARR